MREVKTSGWDLKEVQMAANASINNVKNGFVGTGYYLGIIRSEKLWREDGSASFDEYMSRNYQKDKSWASKCISVYDQFGEQINPGDKPRLRAEYQEYNVSQLFELIYLPEEKREEVTPKTPVKAIRELKPKKEKKVSTVETTGPEKLSAYGTLIKVYPEDSLLTTPGCEGGHDCFSCHLQCDIRQEYCRCVEAPTGNPFPCEQISRVDSLREEIGGRCQFIDLDQAYHRAGDHEPVPCCKRCKEPCQYACERSIRKRETEAQTPEPEALYFTFKNRLTADGQYGACLAKVVRTYLDDLDSRGLHPMSDNIPDIEVQAMGLEYQVMVGHEFVEFEPDRGQTVTVERKRLQVEYEFWYPVPKPEPEPQPRARSIYATPCIHRDGFSCTVPADKKNVPGDGSNCSESCCWECTLHGDCKLECNCSTSRPEEPEPKTVQSEPDPVIDAEFEEVSELGEEWKQIGELNLSCRSENILKRAGIDTVEKLISMSDEEFAAIRGMSNRALEEIKTKLNELESADKAEPEESTTDLQVVRQMLEKENKLLSTCLLTVSDQNDIHIRQMKLKIAALASFACDLDNIENPPPKPTCIYTLEEVAKEITRLEAAFFGAPVGVKQSAPYRKNVMRLDAMRLLYDSMRGE